MGMNLLDIIKNVGSAAVRTLVPGGGLILQAVNEFLPDDKKLPADATGDQVKAAAESLPPAQRAQLLEKEFDVEETQIKESNETLRVMLQSDASNPHSTRPYVVKHAFHVVAFVSVVVVCIWAYGITTKQADLVKAVTDGWPFVAVVITPFVFLLRSYFGTLARESRQRLDAAGGTPSPGVAGALMSLIKRK
jgi:hypothetical protein